MGVRCRVLYVTPSERDHEIVTNVTQDVKRLRIERVETTTSAWELLRAVPVQQGPNLIVLGSGVPAADRMGFLGLLKADTETRTLPVVAFLPEDDQQSANALYDLGVACVVRRPRNVDALKRVVRAVELLWFRHAELPNCTSD